MKIKIYVKQGSDVSAIASKAQNIVQLKTNKSCNVKINRIHSKR